VALAAEAYGVEPARIAKTLSLRIGDQVILIVASGTSRMDNKKVKARFGGKPKMLGLDEVASLLAPRRGCHHDAEKRCRGAVCLRGWGRPGRGVADGNG